MERKKVGRFTFGSDEPEVREPVTFDDDGKINEGATALDGLVRTIESAARPVSWTDIITPGTEEKEVKEVLSPLEIAQKHFDNQGLGGVESVTEKPKHFIEGVKYPEFDDFPEPDINAINAMNDEDRDFNDKLLVPASARDILMDFVDLPADDINYALEADINDVNVEDAYPKPGEGFGRGLKEAFIWGDHEINGVDITPTQSHQLRGMTADFDGDELMGMDRVHKGRRIRKPSKYKKGPRKGRAFLHPRLTRHVVNYGMYGTSVHYINEFRKVK